MKRPIVIALTLLLGACAMTKEEVLAVKPDEAISVLNLRIRMDNNEETSFKNQCGVALKDESGKEYMSVRKDKDTSYYVMKTAPGKIYIDRIGCLSNRVLFNKHRIAQLKDVYFIAEAGAVNYVGDMRIEWDSDRVNPGDFILGMGGLVPDEGTKIISLHDRYQAAKDYMDGEYPDLRRPVKRALVADNPAIIR